MKSVLVILTIAFVTSITLGYAAYEDLSARLAEERRTREIHALAVDALLQKYLHALTALERRQASAEDILVRSAELRLTIHNLRVYNKHSRLEKPQKRRLSVGGSS